MKKKLTWRLSQLPTPDELTRLVENNILTKEEAREVLFKDKEEIDSKSLKSEIKFLRDLVEKLSSDKSETIRIINEVQRPYSTFEWYKPYMYYCSGTGSTTLEYNSGFTGSGTTAGFNGTTCNASSQTIDMSFKDIKTF